MRALPVLLALLVCPAFAAPPRPHVWLVIVDGLDARFATRALMPELFALAERERERTTFFPSARAVMPSRTNPNHVTLLTGVWPATHGITGNAFWKRGSGARPEKLDDPAAIEMETLFTVVESTEPARVTLGAFSKPKLGRLFAAVPGRQRAPDALWSGAELPPARRDPASGYASDTETMGAALAAAADAEPDLAVLNLSDVDRTGHALGPESAEYRAAVTAADAALAHLVDDLRARGRWERSVLVVTADHGMTSVAPSAERPQPVISLGPELSRRGLEGVTVVADGGVEHVYAEPPDADALARAAAVATGTTGVAEVVARVPVPGVALLATVHPDWHLDHQRSGDLLLVAAPGYQFVDPADPVDAALRGNHGAPGELRVPLVVSGGWPGLRAAPAGGDGPSLVDVAPTIAALLGVRAPRRLDGSAVPASEGGRPLAAVLPQSPH